MVTAKSPKSAASSGSEVTSKSEKTGDPRGFKYFILFLVATVVIITVLIISLFYIFRAPESHPEALIGNFSTTKSSSRSTTPIPEKPQIKKLIYAQTLFRHGSRAPDKKFPRQFQKYFPRGKGQLTDRGYNHSFMMGRFFKKRFVDSGFLDARMMVKEMKWLSRAVPRCLATASAVGAGMFQTPKRPFLSVPVVNSQNSREEVYLNFPWSKCSITDKFKKDACPELIDDDSNRNKDEILYDCVGNKHPIFENGTVRIQDSDLFINLKRNDVPIPKQVENVYEIISREYLRIRNFKNGIGNSKWIQMRFGILMDKLLGDLHQVWNDHLINNVTVKFNVYSTQDWVIGGILEGFGLLKHVQSGEEPGYNTMILMELWNKNGMPHVKFFWKPEEVTLENHELRDMTHLIHGCNGSSECSLENFNKCCDSTRIDKVTHAKTCYPDTWKEKMKKWDNAKPGSGYH